LRAADDIKTEIADKIDDLSITDIIKKLIAILFDVVLESAQHLIFLILDIIKIIVSGAMEMLDYPLHIPIISWLYKLITGNELSVLDVICLVAAIPITICYKIAFGEAPFSDDTFDMAKSSSINAFASNLMVSESATLESATLESTDHEKKIKKINFVTGILAMVGSVFLAIFNYVKYNNATNAVGYVLATLAYFVYCAPNYVYLWKYESELKWYDKMNTCITQYSLIKSLVDTLLCKAGIPVSPNFDMFIDIWKKISPYLEFILNLVWMIPVIASIADTKMTSDNVKAQAATSFIGNTCFNVSSMLSPFSNNNPKVTTAANILGIMYGAFMLAWGILNAVDE